MVETLTSSRNGGGIVRPPAPPDGGDDMFAELGDDEEEYRRETRSQELEARQLELSPFIADLSLYGAVFSIDRPVDDPVMPWLNRFSVRHSAN